MWSVEFASEAIKDEFLELPTGLRQRGYKMFELLEARVIPWESRTLKA